MKRLGINSASDGVAFLLGPVRDDSGYYYAAELRTPVVAGKVEVYDHHASDLAAYFAELAELWRRGWDQEKTYESLEGQLTLVATRDAVGHIYLKATLRDGMAGPEYVVSARLVLEAGHLEGISREAEEVQGKPMAAGQ